MAKQLRIRGGTGYLFDGDAEGLILADERGQIRDGDQTLATSAGRSRTGTLHGPVIGTVMSNLA